MKVSITIEFEMVDSSTALTIDVMVSRMTEPEMVEAEMTLEGAV